MAHMRRWSKTYESSRVRTSKVKSQKSTNFDHSTCSDPSTFDVQPITNHQSDQSYNHQNHPILLRLLSFLNGSWNWVALSVLLSTLTIGSSVALIGTSAWLISTAALHPSVADLGVSVVGVRFFGITRGIFRYLERLVSHNVTFRLLARLRVWFYEKLEPLAPARLMEYKSGDLLARVIGDVETLENFYVRVISPSLTAVLIGLFVSIFFASFYPPIALVLIGFFLTLGFDPATPLPDRQPHTGTTDSSPNAPTCNPNSWMGFKVSQICSPSVAAKTGCIKSHPLANNMAQHKNKWHASAAVHSALGTLLTNLGLWLVLLLVIPQVTAGNIKGVMLGTFALMTFASFEAVNPLPLAAQMWNSSREAAKRLFEVVDTEPAVRDRVISEQISVIELPIYEFRIIEFHFCLSNSIHSCTTRCNLHCARRKIHRHRRSERRGEEHDCQSVAPLLGLRSREKSAWAENRSRR